MNLYSSFFLHSGRRPQLAKRHYSLLYHLQCSVTVTEPKNNIRYC